MNKIWKVAGICFEHMHMGDLMREVFEHPNAEIVGMCDADPTRMQEAQANFAVPDDRVFTDYQACLDIAKPDLVILCPATAGHGAWTRNVAPSGAHIFMEKPFASSLEEADAMMAVLAPGQQLVVNWPLRWYPSHMTAKKLVDEGAIGEVLEVHYYDGNRGPLYHGADKIEREPTPEEKAHSWWYSREQGGGSLLDYLGYGATLGAWFNGGRIPETVTTITGGEPSLEVDEHSITLCRYADGRVSKFETRWGTFSDPWTHQPQPKCGFNLVGTEGTIASYDLEPSIRIQTRDCPEGREVPSLEPEPPFQGPIQYVLDCLERGVEVDGPLSPAIARIGQQVVDSAVQSAREGKTVNIKS